MGLNLIWVHLELRLFFLVSLWRLLITKKNCFAICLFQMENTIKQSESERERGLETLRRLHEEYKPLKRDIDKMRGSLGLEKIANLDEESSLAE